MPIKSNPEHSTSLDDHDHSNSHANNDSSSGEKSRPELAKEETRLVWRLKLLVLSVLVASAIAAALLVYFYTHNSEETAFEEQFTEYAGKVMESIVTTVETSLGVFTLLASDITAHAASTNQSWPFVHVPDFAYRVSKTLPLSKSITVTVFPLVPNKLRLAWEDFALKHQYQDMNDTLKIMEIDPNYYGPVDYNCTFNNVIYGDYGDIPYNATRDFVPQWQTYPSICGGWYAPHNWDAFSWSNPASVVNAFNGYATFTQTMMLPDPNDPLVEEENEAWAEFLADYLAPGEESYEPYFELYFPVYDRVPEVGQSQEDYEKERKVGAAIMSGMYWREIFKDILPQGSQGVVVVTKSPCSSVDFTFLLHGPTVEYMGPGDLHDPKYDHLAVSSGMKDLTDYSIRSSKYAGPPLDYDFCPTTFVIYPHESLENYFMSNDPLIFAFGAVAIFVFTSLVFKLYDVSIERRQKLVMKKAKQSTAVVTSLFPEEVAQRLMEEKDDTTGKESKKRAAFDFQKHSSEEIMAETTGDEARPYAGKPIANLYPHCTVFFADIAGFTKWSGTRNPEQVFSLLEALYSAFDKIAKRRRVFKVETIGDCYVAVCGLPEPKENHAVVMCRFARDCIIASNRIVKELDNYLGIGTSDLSMRIGLNSGPVTAGVLRGDKGRYQLFGDTVNTAARMESSGVCNRIHVSEATANLLKAEGKSSWLVEREDTVVAKGKGEMKTWFVNVPSERSVMSGVSGSGERSVLSESTPPTNEDSADDFESKEFRGTMENNGDFSV